MKIKSNTIKGQPGLPAAKIVADKPQHIKDKEEAEKKKRKKENSKMLPWRAGYNWWEPQRVENGGELKRLKRRNEK